MQSSAAASKPAATDSFERDLTALIPHMRAFARSLCGNPIDADDLAQDALAKAWQARGRFTPGTNLKAWTFMIVRNQFYSDKRRSWRSSHLDPEIAAQTLVAIDGGIEVVPVTDARQADRDIADQGGLEGPARRRELVQVAVGGDGIELLGRRPEINAGQHVAAQPDDRRRGGDRARRRRVEAPIAEHDIR